MLSYVTSFPVQRRDSAGFPGPKNIFHATQSQFYSSILAGHERLQFPIKTMTSAGFTAGKSGHVTPPKCAIYSSNAAGLGQERANCRVLSWNVILVLKLALPVFPAVLCSGMQQQDRTTAGIKYEISRTSAGLP